MRLYMRHIRAATICSRGARAWFDTHGLDWSDFLSNGIDADSLSHLDDAVVHRVTKIAQKELDGGQ